MNKINFLIMAIGAILLLSPAVSAYSGYLTGFNSKYGTTGSGIDICSLCHTSVSGGGPLNSYGNAYSNNGYDLASIESMDSDGDGYSNINEINANTFPGDALSPAGTPTTTPAATSTPGTGTDFSSAILFSGNITGSVDANSSVYYMFYASAGQSMNVTLKPDFTDLDLYIYDPAKAYINSSRFIGLYSEKVTFTAVNTGYYFAKIIDYSGYTGTFTITSSGSAYTGTIITIQNAVGSSSMSGAANSVIPVSIIAKNVQNLAAATVTLTYDTALVTVQDVSPGGLGTPTSNIDNNAGNAQITVFSTTGVSGNVSIADLNITAAGSTGTAPLTLGVTALSDSNGASIPYIITSGQITIGQYLRGDMNCDNSVNIVDALLIAKYSVGLIPAPNTC